MRRLLTATLLCLASVAQAQFTQYAAPGSLGTLEAPIKEQVEKSMAEARYKLGPVKLAPWIGLRDLSYYDNVFGTTEDKTSDWTATLGVGLRAYLPLGAKVVVAARALPEYVWWKELDNRRGWNGRYGAGVFAYLNRLSIEALVGRTEELGYVSSEVETPVTSREDRGALDAELKLGGHVSILARASRSAFRFDQSEAAQLPDYNLLGLERDETLLGGGLGYAFSDRFRVYLGGMTSDVAFTNPAFDRSNEGQAPFLEVVLDGNRLHASLKASRWSVQPKTGSTFVETDETVGRVSLTYRQAERLEYGAYAGRSLVYSAGELAPYYLEDRAGVTVGFPLGWRAAVRAFGEWGRQDYAAGEFRNDLRSLGANVTLTVYRQVSLLVGATSQRVDYQNGASTDVLRVQTSVNIGGGPGGW